MGNARVIDMTNEAYHADSTALSNSGNSDVIKDVKDFYQRRILKAYSKESTDAQSLGTMLHSALLVPGEYGSGAVTVPAEYLTKNGAKAGNKYREFESQHKDKIIIKPGEALAQMIEAGGNDPIIRALLEADGDYEHTIFWHDDEYDIERKARLDFLHLDRQVIVDLKTTSKGTSPDAIAATIDFWGYHRQAAYYQDAVRDMYGIDAKFVFIFFSTERPYNVAVHDLSQDYLDLGREENAAGLKKYAECKRTGIWLPDSHGKIITLSPRGSLRWKKEWRLQA